MLVQLITEQAYDEQLTECLNEVSSVGVTWMKCQFSSDLGFEAWAGLCQWSSGQAC